MSEQTYYQNHRDVILKRAKDYYENDKNRLTEQAIKKKQRIIWRRKIYKKRIWKK